MTIPVKRHGGVAGAFAVLLAGALVLSPVSCTKDSKAYKDMMTLEGRIDSKEPPPASVEEVEAAIAKYGKIVDQQVEAGEKLAMYYKLLGNGYLDRKLFGKALVAYRKAVELTGGNSTLYYRLGLCTALVAHNNLGPEVGWQNDVKDGLEAAARYYRRSLDMNPDSSTTLYALAVLDTFDLGNYAEAESLLERYLAIETDAIDGRFVLARVYIVTERPAQALGVYDAILRLNPSPGQKKDAIANREAVKRMSGGGSGGAVPGDGAGTEGE